MNRGENRVGQRAVRFVSISFPHCRNNPSMKLHARGSPEKGKIERLKDEG